MENLHDKIMNIQVKGYPKVMDIETAYKIGHRDARHAAAELSLEYENDQETCESCTHNNDCSIQNAANLSGHGKGFSCSIHETKEEFIKKHSIPSDETKKTMDEVLGGVNVESFDIEELKNIHQSKETER